MSAISEILATIDAEQGASYAAQLAQLLPTAARDHLEELIMTGSHKYQESVQYFEAKGEAKGLVRSLRTHGHEVSPAQEERILACQDLSTIETWYDRAPKITNVDELFTES